MADRVLFISWGTAVRGREERGLEIFNEAVGILGRMQEEGRIEKFDVVLLDPNGELNGYGCPASATGYCHGSATPFGQPSVVYAVPFTVGDTTDVETASKYVGYGDWDGATGAPVDEPAFAEQVRSAVARVVREQTDNGIDIVSDGELSKPQFSDYVADRLNGGEFRNCPSQAVQGPRHRASASARRSG